ncbi:serine protease [Aquibacillus sp. 3ASR75-11]|uniref:Serine protease n=1 Tax=Terrihalobacillus insolitus TaxID=2950438 RepID=A0A9X3WUT9_9BACI|nr:serine protease [Terrihalobacillus insolitus]MDC3413602.1 serine protease [Terrihalobacillus insolitus]MDC3424641.1 serine protease [Terrihalobacillus insolitus]
MKQSDDHKPDIIDEDLYEEIDEEEMLEILKQERKVMLQADHNKNNKPKRPFPKWAFWLIAVAMLINVIAIIPRTFSIPAMNFLVTSAKLSTQDVIDEYKESVVVVEAGSKKGTGFSVSEDGVILTNNHVIEDEKSIFVAFPTEGLYEVEVVDAFPDIDLAVLQVVKNDATFPALTLAKRTNFTNNEHIYFIGNPLAFSGIANEGKVVGYTKLDDWEKKVIMLKAPVYRGNSGSPVINDDGEVIGVIFATLNHSDQGKVGLAVPIDYYYEKIASP